MLTTVTLNAAIDKTYFVPGFELGKVARVGDMRVYPGGKGINVARVACLLGEDVIAAGYIAGFNGAFIEQELDKQRIPHRFVRADGESRICLNVIDTERRTSTELLESGPTITKAQQDQMKLLIGQLTERSTIIAMSGSLAKGLPVDFYAELIAVAQAAGVRVILDTSGDALLAGIEAKPYMIKPNEHEVEKLIGRPVRKELDLLDSMAKLMDRGIACVAVSLGENGACVGWKGRLFRVIVPKVDAVNTVGCGDSFVGGMAAALMRDEDIETCIRFAAAVGTANALTAEAGNINLGDVEKLFKQVRIAQII